MIKTWQSQVSQYLGMTHEEQIKVMQREIDELRAALNGAELFEQSFLHQKGKIERLESQLQERDAEIEQLKSIAYSDDGAGGEGMKLFLQVRAQRKVLEQCCEYVDNVPDDRGNATYIDRQELITAIQGVLKS